MDINALVKLLPEFVTMMRSNKNGMGGLLSSFGQPDMLKGFLGGSEYAKYLPLLPLLTNFNKEGFQGIMKNPGQIAPALSLLGQDGVLGGKALGGIEMSTIASVLPALLPLFSGNAQPAAGEGDAGTEAQAVSGTPDGEEADTVAGGTEAETTHTGNPLAPVADIANKDIIYVLNKAVSKE